MPVVDEKATEKGDGSWGALRTIAQVSRSELGHGYADERVLIFAVCFRQADDEHNVRRPTKAVPDDSGGVKLAPLDLGERLRYLELKTNAWMNWANHYDLDRIEDKSACKRRGKHILYHTSLLF